MTQTERAFYEKNEIIQRYFQDPLFVRFDIKTEAVLKRRQEFFAGRVCAALAYKKITAKDLTELLSNDDRSPRWPAGIVGSISHNEKYVVAELSSKVSAIGIDLATLGSVGKELLTNICNKDDVKLVSGISAEHLLTFIFSFKEALFKAVYPLVKEFFDFHSASVVNIDLSNKTFEIVLDEKISALLSEKIHHPQNKFSLSGDFVFVDPATILSRIILP